MKKILFLAVVIGILCLCLGALADDVTVHVPQSVQIGHPVEINVVFSGTGGTYTIGVRRLDGSHAFGGWGSSVGNRTEITETISGENYLNRYSDITAGTYEAYCIWTKADGSTAEGTKEFVMTGSVPVPPYVQFTSDSFHAAVGESFFLHGTGGSAATLEIQIQRKTENGSMSVRNEELGVQQDGTWSYSFLAEQAGAYQVFIYGYDTDGYSTGSTGTINLYAEDETSLPAPAISTASTQVEAGYEGASFLFTTDTENVEFWMISVTSDDGKESWDSGHTPDDGDGSKAFFYQFVYAGNYSVTVVYQCGGVWSASSTIAITATGTPRPSHGRVPFEVTIPREKLAGNNLAFSLATDVENTSVSCQLSVKTGPYSSAEIYSFSMNSNGSAEIPGYYFEAGKDYTLNINVSADDWMNGYRSINFTTQENPNREPAPAIVSMVPEIAARMQPVTFTFDQTYDRLLCNVKPNDDSPFFGSREIIENTDTWVCHGSYFTSSEADEWILRIFAENNGVWSLPGELIFNVEAMPHLEAPVIVSAPSEVNLLSEFIVTVEPVENAERYCLDLEWYNEADDCYDWIGSSTSWSTTLLFDGWSDEAEPGEYLATVYAKANGYLDSASTQFTMTVIDAGCPAAPVLTLTKQNITTGDYFGYELDRSYGKFRLHREKDGQDYGYNTWEEAGNYLGNFSYAAGQWTVYGQYLENGMWSAKSQPLTFTVTQAPILPVPIVENYPTEVHLYDTITITLTPQQEVDFYDVSLHQVEGDNWYWRGGIGADGPTIEFNEWRNDPTPGSYMLMITSYAEGYDNRESYVELPLIVLAELSDDERPAAPVLTLTKQNITTADSFEFTLDRSYGKFRLHRERDGQDYGYEAWEEAGDSLWIYRYEAGQWIVYGQYQENGVWSAKSQPLTFTVTQAPVLPSPIVVSCPTEVHLYDTISITLMPQQEVEFYDVSLYWVENGMYWRGNTRAEGPIIEFAGWRNDPTPGSYMLMITSCAEGYDNVDSYVQLPLTVLPAAEPADARIFTLPGSLERIEAEAFEGSIATMFVIPENCMAIESRAFANCRSLVRVVIPNSVRTIADDAFDGCYSLTIVTPAGSAADIYARAHGWTVENN